MRALDWLCHMETIEEIAQAVTPEQLEVITLAWRGLNNREIGKLLGISHQAVSARRQNARKQIAKKVPEVAHEVEVRRMPTGVRRTKSNYEQRLRNNCVDCGAPVGRRATRCVSCKGNGRQRKGR